MFRIDINIEKGFENKNFRYFKPDLGLKGLRLNLEAELKKELFYEMNN